MHPCISGEREREMERERSKPASGRIEEEQSRAVCL
jgi:hypothetical protein